jgi:hypothetical protein
MKKHSLESIEKIRLSAYTRDNSKRIASMPKGKNHWNYSENPSKLALHRRIHRKYGPAKQFKCNDCEKPAKDYSNETGKYTDNIADYVPRCRSCHVKKDKNWLKK